MFFYSLKNGLSFKHYSKYELQNYIELKLIKMPQTCNFSILSTFGKKKNREKQQYILTNQTSQHTEPIKMLHRLTNDIHG